MASVKVILGTVAFTVLQHLEPRIEYPFKSNLLMDQGYSSIATGIYPCMFNSTRMYNIIFLFFLVTKEYAPPATSVAYL